MAALALVGGAVVAAQGAQARPVAKAIPRPVVSKISATSSPVAGGARVTVTGRNFTKATTLKFCATAGKSVRVVSQARLTVVVPAHPQGTCNVVAGTAGGSSKPVSSARITYVPAPAVSSLTPASGSTAGGTAITVRGSGFTQVRSVTIGGAPVSALRVRSATTMTMTTPARSAGGAALRVTTAFGVNQARTFVYTAPQPAPSVVPSLAGRVTRDDGTGVKNAEVDIFSVEKRVLYQIVSTSSDGSYSLSNAELPAGHYKVCVNAIDATDARSDIGAPNGYTVQCSGGLAWNGRYEYDSVPSAVDAVAVSPGHTVIEHDTVAPGARITGAATDTVNKFSLAVGATLFRAGVEFAGANSNNAANQYVFAGLLPGAYTLCIDGSDIHTSSGSVSLSPNGYDSACYDAVVWDPHTTDMTAAARSATVVSLSPASSQVMNLDLVPNSFATVSGTVTATNGDPLAGVDVEPIRVTSSGESGLGGADTDANGAYAFNLAVGTYKLCFFANLSVVGSPGVPAVSGGPSQGGYASQCYDGASGPDETSTDTDALVAAATTITVGSSGTITIDPQLASLATLAGTVEDPHGAPVGGSVLWLYRDGQRLGSRIAGASDGTFSFSRMEPGTYTLCLVPQSDAAKAFGETNRCYSGVVLSSESVAPSSDEAKQGTPITVAAGERQDLTFSLTP